MTGKRLARALLPLGAAACLGHGALVGQDVRLAEEPRTEAQRALAEFLDRGAYALWTRDTVLAREDTVGGHVLILESTARLAGRVEGDVYVVDGDLFLRAGGSVSGDVVVLGGGFYDSDLATVEGTITYRPNERVRVRPTEGALEIIAEVRPLPAVELDGTYGVRLPAYQRVDAVTLGWGGLARARTLPARPDLELVVRYRTGPGEVEASLRNSWHVSGRVRVAALASRSTITMDGWIRPDWYNSLATVVAEDDARSYYRADRLGLELEWRAPAPPLWEDAPAWRATLSAGWEEARSIEARDIWAVFEDEDAVGAGAPPGAPHPNPPVDEGDLYRLAAGFEWSRRATRGRTGFGIGLEAAHDEDLEGDLSFLLAEGRVSARHATGWGHAWEAFAIARVDLAGTPPRQRHSTLGGPGTLPTLDLRSRRGARLLYAELSYAAPLLGLATLGGLDAFVRGSAGGAWDEGRSLRIDEGVAGGFAARLWEFQMELGIAVGSDPGVEGARIVPYFDVRVRRSARPTSMARPGRGG